VTYEHRNGLALSRVLVLPLGKLPLLLKSGVDDHARLTADVGSACVPPALVFMKPPSPREAETMETTDNPVVHANELEFEMSGATETSPLLREFSEAQVGRTRRISVNCAPSGGSMRQVWQLSHCLVWLWLGRQAIFGAMYLLHRTCCSAC
jgi:hypothetical protein